MFGLIKDAQGQALLRLDGLGPEGEKRESPTKTLKGWEEHKRGSPEVIWVLIAPMVKCSLRGICPAHASWHVVRLKSPVKDTHLFWGMATKPSSCSSRSKASILPACQGRSSDAQHGRYLHSSFWVQAGAAAGACYKCCFLSVCSQMLLYQEPDYKKSKQGERSPPILSQHIKQPADISNPQAQEFIVLISEQRSAHQTAAWACPRCWHLSC